MIYGDFQNEKLSLLGFGAMRLPCLADGSIDENQVAEMTRLAMEAGVNYFDTAYPYHGGQSERVMGRVLAKYPRSSYNLATKYPGHQILSSGYNPAEIFEEQLKKCGVDYFDFYLLHNVNEKSMEVYMDPQWGIVDYFKEQKRLGRIRHLGFSSHAQVAGLEKFLDYCGGDMEFCQIQLNYMDWTLQKAREKYDLLTARGIPVWVMEPVRGGKLAALSQDDSARLKAIRPNASDASWGFRFLQGLPNVKMILSGMSNLEQMRDNLATFANREPLSPEETELLLSIARGMMDIIPCTACRYCCEGCPKGLDIPNLLSVYNEIRVTPSVNAAMRVEFLPEEKKPTACIACGKCARSCPQNIDVPGALKALAEKLTTIPSWAETCRQREAAAKAGKK
ncbi:MAG: aldo/keto reductase [Faecousia sp.]